MLMLLPDKLQATLRSEGGIKALLGMVRCRHPDVLSQIARGIANFAKCESRASTNGKSWICCMPLLTVDCCEVLVILLHQQSFLYS